MIRQINEKYQMITYVEFLMGTAFSSQIVVEIGHIVHLTEIKESQIALREWLDHVDQTFSPFIESSELMRYNRGEVGFLKLSNEMKYVLASCNQAKRATKSAFNANYSIMFEPSGFVKGWAIEEGVRRYLNPLLSLTNVVAVNLNGGGDMQMVTRENSDWQFNIAVQNPFDKTHMIAKIPINNGAIATSGISERGHHIVGASSEIYQTTVIGQRLQEVDVWATALMVNPLLIIPSHLSAFYVTVTGKIYEKKGIKNVEIS